MAYFNLGKYSRSLTGVSRDAQIWFDRGLNWTFGFNHEEAIVCFEKSLEADPNCAMAAWGIAYAIGPNYNKPWELFEPDEKVETLKTAHDALASARAAEGVSDVEAAMVEALAKRLPSDPTIEDFDPWNDAFVDAMRPIYQANQNDLEVISVFAEACMNRTPWLLWNMEEGKPADGASTEEAREILEGAFARLPGAWDHPGLLHLYIHLMEMSPWPELALSHGDRLVDLVPDSGHLVHMATHIDVLCGEYQNVVARNHAAAAVDRRFVDYAGSDNFYTLYRIHNVHFEAYGAMFMGRRQQALDAASTLKDLLPVETVAYLPDFFEAFWGIELHVMVRFGMWDEILSAPLPEDSELFSFTTALSRYARVVALANLGRAADAAAEFERFVLARDAVQDTRYMFNNPASDVLKIAEAMAQGEMAYKSGDVEIGFDHLRDAVAASDGLLYDEPWGWMQPPRHALAALLMDQSRYAEAEPIYRADLGLDDTLARPVQHPRNVWSLHGLDECLRLRNDTVERPHVAELLDLALARADVPIRASCYCRSVAA